VKINVEIGDEVIQRIVEDAAKSAFQTTSYSKGDGAAAIGRAVAVTVGGMDMMELVRPIVAKYAHEAAVESVREEVKKYARKVVKDMKDAGELFPSPTPTERSGDEQVRP